MAYFTLDAKVNSMLYYPVLYVRTLQKVHRKVKVGGGSTKLGHHDKVDEAESIIQSRSTFYLPFAIFPSSMSMSSLAST